MAQKYRLAVLPALIISGMILTACTTGLLPGMDGQSPAESPVDVGDAPTATVTATASDTAPQDMPTAEPLWTPTLPATAADPAILPVGPARPEGEPLDASVAAMVNDVTIPREAYARQLDQAQMHLLAQPGLDIRTPEGVESLRQLQEQVLDWMIDQVIIEQAATREGVTVSENEVEASIARMRGTDAARFEAWLDASGLTLESLREQVRMDLVTTGMRDRVTASLSDRTLQINVRHILLSQEVVAESVLNELRQGGNFITVARRYSEDELTRQSGGELGFLPRGVMSPDFEEAAFALQPGEISDVVHTASGLHIIQLVEIDPERQVPAEYWPVVQQRAFEDWLAAQRAMATIQRNAP